MHTFYRSPAFYHLICLLILSALPLTAQVLSGKVRDANSWHPISDVNISIQGIGGVQSDVGGEFHLPVSRADSSAEVIFQHVAYDTLRLPLSAALMQSNFYMTVRIISLEAVETVSRQEQPRIALDIPQTIRVLESREFETRGYVDAGDLMRNQQSIQIDEDISGKKALSIRGGNPDDVIVLYHGININSVYDRSVDFSRLDVEDVERFEIIKGSNSVLYGPQAFSGVINVTPRRQRDYNIRFRQRIGSYASGDWGLHLNGDLGPINGNYSYKRGASERTLSNTADRSKLINSACHQTAGISVVTNNQKANGLLDVLFLSSSLQFENQRDDENSESSNQLLGLHWDGNIGPVKAFTISSAWQGFSDEQQIQATNAFLAPAELQRTIDDQAIHLRVDKVFSFEAIDLLTGYQFENHLLDFEDQRFNVDEISLGLASARLSRRHHGAAAVLKWHFLPDSRSLQTADFDISFRYDDVRDSQSDAVTRGDQQSTAGVFEENSWQQGTVKFSSYLAGKRRNFAFKAFMNYGTNVKFPSLFQQISAPAILLQDPAATDSSGLQPEENRSLEAASEFTWEMDNGNGINGYLLGLNLFRNHYKDKLLTFVTPGASIAFYDNVETAEISGLEIRTEVTAVANKVRLEGSASFYNISEKLAFPFKYERKQVVKASIDHRGYSLQTTWFNEGPQTGWIRQSDSGFVSVELPAFRNFDVHFSKFFEIYQLKLILNASLRNILSDDTELSGLALRDRRYYLTFAAQW